MIKEDDKMPLFLVKLWNIVEDPSYYDIIRWDESGYSFHILDPYSFCRNVLPQYFKHNNLNSLIRQLNMYGFRKMTPIERTSLARAESDQDHLEFSHPCFVRDHPDLLSQIKRKTPSNKREEHAAAVPQRDISSVLEEVRQLREKQRVMEDRMSELVAENASMWEHMRVTHLKQQQMVNKLAQFLATLVQPKRLGKRHMLAIDDAPASKRPAPVELQNPIELLQDPIDLLQHPIQQFQPPIEQLQPPPMEQHPPPIDQFQQPMEPRQRQPIEPIQQHVVEPIQQRIEQIQQPVEQIQQPVSQVQPQVEQQLPTTPEQSLGFTPSDFADYLSGMNEGIDNCRNSIGDYWDNYDFDNLLDDSVLHSPELSHNNYS